MVGEDSLHCMTVIAVTVVVGVAVVVSPGVQIIVVCSLTEVGLLSSSTLIFVLILSFQWLCFAVLVTGLPSSASWQDLKVNFQVQMCYTLTSRLILHF